MQRDIEGEIIILLEGYIAISQLKDKEGLSCFWPSTWINITRLTNLSAQKQRHASNIIEILRQMQRNRIKRLQQVKMSFASREAKDAFDNMELKDRVEAINEIIVRAKQEELALNRPDWIIYRWRPAKLYYQTLQVCEYRLNAILIKINEENTTAEIAEEKNQQRSDVAGTDYWLDSWVNSILEWVAPDEENLPATDRLKK